MTNSNSMANEDQIKILRQGAETWNKWMTKNPDELIDLMWADLRRADLHRVDLHRANLSGANLHRANLSRANLHRVDLSGANLHRADLSGANLHRATLIGAYLSGANLRRANLRRANLSGADLSGADLSGANLSRADLSKVDLSGADLSRVDLIETNLNRATLAGCIIYGISAWELKLEDAKQNDLVITPPGQPAITIDNLEVAQFVYLLLHNEKIRNVIDTIGKKAVLILGRFTPERKLVLDAIKKELRNRGYLPILFDFEKSEDRDIAETVSILAHMARFIIADITDARSIPAELSEVVKDIPSVPVQPLILYSDYTFALFEHIIRYPWVLDIYRYENQTELINSIETKVIAPAERKADELKKRLEDARRSLQNVTKESK